MRGTRTHLLRESLEHVLLLSLSIGQHLDELLVLLSRPTTPRCCCVVHGILGLDRRSIGSSSSSALYCLSVEVSIHFAMGDDSGDRSVGVLIERRRRVEVSVGFRKRLKRLAHDLIERRSNLNERCILSSVSEEDDELLPFRSSPGLRRRG